MIDPDTLADQAAKIAAMNGLSREDAESVLGAIGDTPTFDPETGLAVAVLADGRRILVKLPE